MSALGTLADRLSTPPRLGLQSKLLLPLVLMTTCVGAVGVAFVSHTLGEQVRDQSERELVGRSVQAEAALRDVGLALADATRLGANLEGVPAATRTGDTRRLDAGLVTVVGSRAEVNFAGIVGTDGRHLGALVRRDVVVPVTVDWTGSPLSLTAAGTQATALLNVEGVTMLASSWPIMTEDGAVAGSFVSGAPRDSVIEAVAEESLAVHSVTGPDQRPLVSLVEFSEDGDRRGAPGAARRVRSASGEQYYAVDRPLVLIDRPLATLTVRTPIGDAAAAARKAAAGLVWLFAAAIAGIVGLGAVLTRRIVSQVRELVETNRRLGLGDLFARAKVTSTDELGELAEGFNQMAEQLEAAERELELAIANSRAEVELLYSTTIEHEKGRSALLAEIVHDFRNDLFPIVGYAQLMSDPEWEPQGTEWRFEYGEVIRRSSEQLQRRIDDVLDLARSEAGQLDLDLTPVSLNAVVAEMSTTIRALARRGLVQATISLDPDLPPVRGDYRRVGEVLMNLVSNAVKYTKPGGSMMVTAAASRDVVTLSVADTGIGIPAGAVEEVFKPFYRVRGAAAQAGFSSSGLGLASTKRVVEAMGGLVSCTSVEGAGSVFTIALPIHVDTTGPAVDHVHTPTRTRHRKASRT